MDKYPMSACKEDCSSEGEIANDFGCKQEVFCGVKRAVRRISDSQKECRGRRFVSPTEFGD